jgi:hypothetical protein
MFCQKLRPLAMTITDARVMCMPVLPCLCLILPQFLAEAGTDHIAIPLMKSAWKVFFSSVSFDVVSLREMVRWEGP